MSANLSFNVAGVRTEVVFAPVEPSSVSLAVMDENTRRLSGTGFPNILTLPAGELAKTWQSVESVLRRGVELGLGRDATMAGLGGGVICDLTAFAASLYMRGCGLVLAPTTLLAMVDASLGGKTGVDFMGYKNLVGTFYPASRIHVDVGALASLPEREYVSGLAEVIKTAVIGDAELLALLERSRREVLAREPGVMEEMIRRSLAVKGPIVEEDPWEKGRRAVLNLGHTFGHALESATGFSSWTHGEAVAWGIGRALAVGERLGMTDRGFRGRVESLLRDYGFRLQAPVRYEDLAPAFERDKKRRGGAVRIIVPRGPCDIVIREAGSEELSAALGES